MEMQRTRAMPSSAFVLLMMAVLAAACLPADAGRRVHKHSGSHSDRMDGGPAAWSALNVTTVHFVSSCHLDVGFAKTAVDIVNKYFDSYFPASIKTSEELRQAGGEERLVFLTHTYLVSLYLDCPPNMGLHCPNDDAKNNFMEAVKRGDIVWHAMPFNSELEVLDASMVDFSVQLTHDLDSAMGRNATITMSQRDVPGTTRSIIPILKKRGVEAITVGVNGASMPPAVPSIFRWVDPISQADVIAMWHPGGYGGQRCCSVTDTVVMDGVDHALVFGVRGDNSGPPSAIELKLDWAKIRKLFPNAKIVASDYDAFVRAVMPHKESLPVFSEEIGDTWIYGVPSDPWKVAASRAIMTARSDCLASGKCQLQDKDFYNFSRLLLKAGEHTWGLDVKSYLGDSTNWSNDKFHPLQYTGKFVTLAGGWHEQRDWAVNYAVEALPTGHPLLADITAALERIGSASVNLDGYAKVTDTTQVFKVGAVEIGFSSTPAGISHLTAAGVQFASDSNLLATLLYQSFTSEDYQTFMGEYLLAYKKGSWMDLDFGKPGLDKVAGVAHQDVSAKMSVLWMKENSDGSTSFVMDAAFDESLVTGYGAPQRAMVNVTVSASGGIIIGLAVLNKTATRLPESVSLHFNPVVSNASSMMMEKVGETILVTDVLNNGSRHLHGVGMGGITYKSTPGFAVSSDHVAVVCVGDSTPFPVPNATPDVSKGFSFNVVNNIWGTNYIMWYPFTEQDRSFLFDFKIDLPH